MQISAPALSVLRLLFQAGSSTLSRPRLARHTGLDQPALSVALDELTRYGLIDARRLRLTLPGLALAAASSARSNATERTSQAANAGKSARAAARQDRRTAPPIALFSQREPPRAVA